MKKLIAFILALISILPLAAYKTPSTGSNQKPHILKAWTGDFSEEKLLDAINKYQSNYDNIVFKSTIEMENVSFETDFEVASCSVSRLSRVDENDIKCEMTSYIDQFIETSFEGHKVTIATDWWNVDGDWVKNHTIWSYLIRMTDKDGNVHYYYFRTDYSAFM